MCYREMKMDLQKLAHGQIFHNAVVKLLRQRAQRHVAVLPGDRLPESVAGPLAAGQQQLFIQRSTKKRKGPAAVSLMAVC